MMIKCQKCGFENQMGSIFCRDCGEKLDMDAIDPNKLQKDVNKEKNLKRAKKRIKSLISAGITLLVVGAFIFVILYSRRDVDDKFKAKDSSEKKFNAVLRGNTVGRVTFTYPEINYMFRDNIVQSIYNDAPFARPLSVEVAYDEKKDRPVVYMWLKLGDKVPMLYTVHGELVFNVPDPEKGKDPNYVYLPITADVKRLDIGLLPVHLSTKTFLNGFTPLLDNDSMRNFFRRAQDVQFTPEGMTVEFTKGGPVETSDSGEARPAPPSSASANVARKIPSVAKTEQMNDERNKRIQEEAEKKSAKAEEAKAKEEERKRKAEEYRQQQKEKEEERKRKAEEEKERKKQEAEERKRRQEEENERRRQEAEERRRNRNNNNNNSRSSRNRNNRW